LFVITIIVYAAAFATQAPIEPWLKIVGRLGIVKLEAKSKFNPDDDDDDDDVVEDTPKLL
jgi:hypothetical protein